MFYTKQSGVFIQNFTEIEQSIDYIGVVVLGYVRMTGGANRFLDDFAVSGKMFQKEKSLGKRWGIIPSFLSNKPLSVHLSD